MRREGTSEAAPEAVRRAVRGGCRSGWGRLLSVTNAMQTGTWRHGGQWLGIGWAPWKGGGGRGQGLAPEGPLSPRAMPVPVREGAGGGGGRSLADAPSPYGRAGPGLQRSGPGTFGGGGGGGGFRLRGRRGGGREGGVGTIGTVFSAQTISAAEFRTALFPNAPRFRGLFAPPPPPPRQSPYQTLGTPPPHPF